MRRFRPSAGAAGVGRESPGALGSRIRASQMDDATEANIALAEELWQAGRKDCKQVLNQAEEPLRWYWRKSASRRALQTLRSGADGILRHNEDRAKDHRPGSRRASREGAEASGTGITQTVRAGLGLLAASQAYARLRQFQGKVRFTHTLAELKADR